MSTIESIQVRGLRASGTNYMDSLMEANFDVRVVRSLYGTGHTDFGWKHGLPGSEAREYVGNEFLVAQDGDYVRYEDGEEIYRIAQDDTDYVGQDAEGDTYVRNRVEPVTDSSLLVVVHRNPLKWLQSVQLQPHHAPGLYGLGMSAFIRSPWRTFYTAPSADVSPDAAERQKWLDKGRRLGEMAIEDEVSVFMHRARSIVLFELLQESAPNVVYVNYENLRQHPGTILGRIALLYDIPLKSDGFENTTSYKGNGKKPYIERPYDPISKADLLYIMKAIDWDAEREIGYQPIRDFSTITDENEIPDAACTDPTNLVVFNPRLRCYMSRQPEQNLPGVISRFLRAAR